MFLLRPLDILLQKKWMVSAHTQRTDAIKDLMLPPSLPLTYLGTQV